MTRPTTPSTNEPDTTAGVGLDDLLGYMKGV